jgi:phage tail-like protein
MSIATQSIATKRHLVPGARSPFPLEAQIPAMLADDPMVCAFLRALDEVIAPVIHTLDCFDAYLDPHLAPPDMTAYIGSWVLADIDNVWDEAAIRDDVANAHQRASWSGTAHAIRARLVPREAASVEIEDSGATLVSMTPTSPTNWVTDDGPTVRVRIDAPDIDRLRHIVARLVPAHVTLEVESAN